MDAAALLRTARHEGGWTLRQLAARAGTSHSTLAAYEAGRVHPTVSTLERILKAAGFDTRTELRPRPGGTGGEERGEELRRVLELAAAFPAHHEPDMAMPPFGR
jgi:transcriptional regulator with XRE-family HTH domain